MAKSEIIRILEFYTANDRILEKEHIFHILFYYLKENNLEHLLVGIRFVTDTKTFGSYCDEEKVIELNLQNMYNYACEKYMNCNFNIPFSIIVNMLYIHTLFHEIGHAISWQYPQIRPGVADDIVSYVLRNIDYDLQFTDLHDMFPSEKEANTFAYEICLKIYQSMDPMFINDDVIKLLYIDFFEMLLDGYNTPYTVGYNPLFRVLSYERPYEKGINDYKLMYSDIKSNGLNLYDRLRFGFPITNEEEEFLNNLFNNIRFQKQRRDLNVKKLILGRMGLYKIKSLIKLPG